MNRTIPTPQRSIITLDLRPIIASLVSAVAVCLILPTPLSAQRPVVCRVALFDADGEQLSKGTVQIRLVASGEIIEPSSTEPPEIRGYVFTFRDVPRQAVEVTAAHPGYEPQTFVIDLGLNMHSESEESIMIDLAQPGDAYYVQHGRTYAYRPRPTTIAVSLRVPSDSMRRVFDSLGLRLSGGTGGSTVFLHKAIPFDRWNSPELAYLRRHPGVTSAGPIRRWRQQYGLLKAFTDKIIVRFTNDECLDSLNRRSEFAEVKTSPFEPGKAVLRVRPEIGEGIVDLSREISQWKGITDIYFDYILPAVH